MGHRVGFLSTRFAGTDGVSLESAKWAQLLWDHEHTSFWYAGKLDRDIAVSSAVPHAFFGHPDIEWINRRIFGCSSRDPEVTRRIYALSEYLNRTIYEFVDQFEIEILVIENAVTIPMNVPLGLAVTNFVAETAFPTIAHHHDFYWERDRFSVNAVGDMLGMAFPPSLPTIQHVTINSPAQQALSHRRGESSILVPNVLDFENPPDPGDEYVNDFRSELGFSPDDILFLQPTRVVPRKGIEHSIALLAALKDPRCKMVISHESGDEGDEYLAALLDLAEHEGVDLRLIGSRVGERGVDEEGRKRYNLEDCYSAADFITYPSLYEGFGNALLEAFYYSKPVLVNRYSIFISDIEPKGFRTIAMNGIVTREVLEQVQHVIRDEAYREEMVSHNFELGKMFFSYAVLRRKLRALVTNITGMESL